MRIAISAFRNLKPEEQNQALYADLCNLSGLAWAHQGLFAFARPWLEQSHQIRADTDPPNGLELSWTEVNMGNLECSFGNYFVSLEWQIKALQSRQSSVKDDLFVMHPQADRRCDRPK